jgi:hypothetical protein
MPISTTQLTVRTISDAELARANALETTVSTQAAEIARLQALLAPPPPPAPTRPGLYVDAGKLRTRLGAELRLRVIEVMVNGNAAGFPGGFPALLAKFKNDLGANAVSPLFQGSQGALAQVKAFCDAALALKLVVGVNADHQSAGRAWLLDPAMVVLMNSYPHVYLESEVETGDGGGTPTLDVWAAAEKSKIAAFRAAGHTTPVKVGCHAGGRELRYPLARGADVLAADPLHKLVFTWQAYWGAAGNWYQSSNGYVSGVAGTLAALDACAASGLCFIPGFDFADDVGTTGQDLLLDRAVLRGLSHAHWAATGDGARPQNNCYDWDFGADGSTSKPMADLLRAKWTAARAAFPDVTAL